MAITNQERVGKAMDLLRAGLAPVVDREVKEGIRTGKVNMETIRRFAEDPLLAEKPIAKWDVSPLLKLMWDTWNDVFGRILGRAERSLVQELRDWRNKWAHQEPFSSDDTDRALDSITRLLAALSAPQADDVAKMTMELRRLTFEEQVRREKRKAGGSLIESSSTLKPWREIITPHPDVASGRYEHAEFAADLWQVNIGQGTEEYRNPVEFFRRTYLTGSLRRHFDISRHPTRIAVVEPLRGQCGYLTLTRLTIASYEREEHLLFSGLTDDGAALDQETMEKLFQCGGHVAGTATIPVPVSQRLAAESERHAQATLSRSLEQNNRFFHEAREKLERWADDMVLSAEKALADTKEQIKALRRQARQATTLAEQHAIQEKLQKLERQQRRQRQEIFRIEDEIMEKRDQLIDQLEQRLAQRKHAETLFTIRWAVV